MFQRLLNPTKTNSFFLFGPRGTGKTTLLKMLYPPEKTLFIDLLDPVEEDTFIKNPSELQNRLAALPSSCEWIVIDEIQKAPKLLDLVHKLIEETRFKFVLTGSSGRKLKRGVSNLLAGRAFVYHLHPLTFNEIGNQFELNHTLHWGSLPGLYRFETVEDKQQFLQSYSLTYLKEEIFAEQIIRKLDPFRSFLEVAAQNNGKIINYSAIAQDLGVDTKTVQSYYQILEDTMIGFRLPAYHRSLRKRQRMNPKFYYFDLGVKKALDRTLAVPVQEGTYSFGCAFEHFVIAEFVRLCQYKNNDWQFFYLRTKDHAEIDLIIERPGETTLLIEIKSTSRLAEKDVATLIRFKKENDLWDAVCISRDKNEKIMNSVLCMHWKQAFSKFGFDTRKRV